MYMDIKKFAKNEQELETQQQTRGINSQNIEMGFGIEKCVWLIMKKVLFNCLSIIVCYLMPNFLYTYMLNIYDLIWLKVI